MTEEKELLCIAAGAVILIAALLLANKYGPSSAARQSDGGMDVEEKTGARVPYYSRNGHYAEFGRWFLPIEWESHRLTYPRKPCPLLSGLQSGDLSINKPAFDPDQRAWFSEPPAESLF
jgi:hypothetical protein